MAHARIRDLRPDETGFLRDMLYAAIAWRPGRWLPPKVVLLRLPQLTMLHKGWGAKATPGSSPSGTASASATSRSSPATRPGG